MRGVPEAFSISERADAARARGAPAAAGVLVLLQQVVLQAMPPEAAPAAGTRNVDGEGAGRDGQAATPGAVAHGAEGAARVDGVRVEACGEDFPADGINKFYKNIFKKIK